MAKLIIVQALINIQVGKCVKNKKVQTEKFGKTNKRKYKLEHLPKVMN